MSFIFDADETPEDREKRLARGRDHLAQALMSRGRQPATDPWGGAADAASSIAGAYLAGKKKPAAGGDAAKGMALGSLFGIGG